MLRQKGVATRLFIVFIIGIRFFCQVLTALLRAVLGKVLRNDHVYREQDIRHRKHSAKTPLSSVKLLANLDTRQKAISSRLYLTVVTFAEYQALALDKVASLSSVS